MYKDFDINSLSTPYYAVDKCFLKKNLQILKKVMRESGAKILLAQKAFSMFSVYPLIDEYLVGTTASGLYEARLAREESKGEVHIFSPAYTENEFEEILKVSDHIVFNSIPQLRKFKDRALAAGKEVGLRINTEHSTQDHEMYDPSGYQSRLGVTLQNIEEDALEGIHGLHFHSLCEQNFDALESTLQVFESKFSKYFSKLKWVNFGGGHHITRKDYDVQGLIKCVVEFRKKYNIDVYLEPGEAIAYQAGYFVAEVVDLFYNNINIAILNASAACHMPDVLEMPYRPMIVGAGEANEKKYTYKLGGHTCLAGDNIGEYSFDNKLQVGDKLIFLDMAIYSMVKNNTFNGMKLPAIALVEEDGKLTLVKEFGYDEFKRRLS